jgi:cytochrome c oxidase cbb3-type subunit I/II
MTKKNHNRMRLLALTLLLLPGFPSCAQESHIGNLTGQAGRGKKLYQRYCIGCHGENGDGRGENAAYVDPKPRDFTTGTFKCRSTPSGTAPLDSDLYDTIGRGLYSTAMPPWGPLTRRQRADLVAYIKSFSSRFREEKPGAPLQIPTETPTTQDSIDRGRELYQTTIKCALCHGKEGRGDGPSASALTDSKGLPIAPYDFTSSTRFKCGGSDEDLYRVLMTGLDGTPMPSFSNSLKAEQAWDLIHYVRTFHTESRWGFKRLRAKKRGDVSEASGR